MVPFTPVRGVQGAITAVTLGGAATAINQGLQAVDELTTRFQNSFNCQNDLEACYNKVQQESFKKRKAEKEADDLRRELKNAKRRLFQISVRTNAKKRKTRFKAARSKRVRFSKKTYRKTSLWRKKKKRYWKKRKTY